MSEAFYCQTQDLAIGYGKTPLLQNIGIGVQRGQILALIGPNGAGIGGVGCQVLALQQHSAALRRQLPGQRFEQGGFARAVGANQR